MRTIAAVWRGLRARILCLVPLGAAPILPIILYTAGQERGRARTEALELADRLSREAGQDPGDPR